MGFVQPMPVQEAVIPTLIESRRDTIALAQTGTGKTAAFGIPLLQRISLTLSATEKRGLPRALVLSPTRELCLQIADDLRDFSKYIEGIHIEAVYGGAAIEPQMRALKKGTDIIVATPGRLIDLKNRGFAHLEQVQNIVLDEADEMLNMGFSDSINMIFSKALARHNATLMFSATMKPVTWKTWQRHTPPRPSQEIVVGSRNKGAPKVLTTSTTWCMQRTSIWH